MPPSAPRRGHVDVLTSVSRSPCRPGAGVHLISQHGVGPQKTPQGVLPESACTRPSTMARALAALCGAVSLCQSTNPTTAMPRSDMLLHIRSGLAAVVLPEDNNLVRAAGTPYADLPCVAPDARRLVLCRHGETVLNRWGLPQGRLMDVPLDGAGAVQARQLGAALASGPPLALVGSSPRVRARQTAAAVVTAALAAPGPVPRLLPPEPEIDELFGIESTSDARLRARRALHVLAAQLRAGEAGCWVSHSRFLRVLLLECERPADVRVEEELRSARDYYRAGFAGLDLANAGISVVDVQAEGRCSVRVVNSIGHLQGRKQRS